MEDAGRLTWLDEASTRIRSHDEYHNDLASLRQDSLRAVLRLPRDRALDEGVFRRLSQAAAVFANSEHPSHRSAAYDIATALATVLPNDHSVMALASVIFAALGNFVALHPLGLLTGVSSWSPLPATVDALYHEERNSVKIGASDSITLTDLQRKLWVALSGGRSVSITAPTSAGKSYVLFMYLVERFVTQLESWPFRVIYLAPTRALITQMLSAIRGAFDRFNVKDVSVTTTPLDRDDDVPIRLVAIWTQERLQLSLSSHPLLGADVIVVDEAQMIGDGGRGVILSNVIDELLRRNPESQVFFASPFVDNPDVLGEIFSIRSLDVVRADDKSVGQNIIFADTKGRQLSLDAWLEGERVSLGTILLPHVLTTQEERLSVIPRLLSTDTSSLVYARGAAEAESVAESIAAGQGTRDDMTPRVALSQLAADVVHPSYALVETALAGVGFHYGRMPAIIRKAVEDSFSSGALTYLITTSTLLHGVNLPARNIFLHKPTRGRRIPISSVDFWNLAGRAGRLGKELQGNVFLIDYDSWPVKPLQDTKTQTVRPSLTQILGERSGDFVRYIESADVLPPERSDFDNAFVRLFTDLTNGRLEATFEKAGVSAASSTAIRIGTLLRKAVTRSSLSAETIAQNPTVSVYRQQALYATLLRGIRTAGPQRFLLPHPERADAYERLADAMRLVHTTILDYPATDKRHRFFAFQAVLWMKGSGIPELVERQVQYKKARGKTYEIGRAIRETLTLIEEDLRFQYVRLLSCYINVLSAALADAGYEAAAGSIATIPLYLEIGASQRTTVSLMSLGLSRFSAIKLGQLTTRSDLSPSSARRWLLSVDETALDISPFVEGEIREVKRGLS